MLITTLADRVFSHLSDNLNWEPVDGKDVDGLLKGLEVIGAEPIDYPTTDGIIIYLKSGKGAVLALDISADFYDTNPERYPFYIRVAKAKPEKSGRVQKGA